MATDYGLVPLGTTDFALMFQAKNSSRAPAAVDVSVAYDIYAMNGSTPLLSGTTTTNVNSQTGLYQKTGLSITTANGFIAGMVCFVRITYSISSAAYVDEGTFQVT